MIVGLLRGVVQKNVVTRPYVRAREKLGLTPALRKGASCRHRSGRDGRPAGLAFAAVAIGLLIAHPARAELNLRWEAPSSCPRRSDVLDRIRTLAGTSLDKFEGLSAEGRIARTNGRFSLTLSVRDGRQQRKRVITSESCADLAGAAAITLALLLGVDTSAADASAPNDARSQATSREGEADKSERNVRATVEAHLEQPSDGRAKEPDKQSEESVRDRVSADDATTPDRASSRRWNVLIRAPSVAVGLGPLPDPSVGLGLGAGIGYESWRFLIAGHLYRAQAVSAMEPAAAFAAGADLERISAHLGVCRGFRSDHFEIAPCIGMAVEHATARGFGQGVSPEAQSAFWLAPSVGAAVHWYALKWAALFVGVQGELELSRPRMVIQGLGEVRQLGPVSASGTVGLEWIL